MPQLIKQEDGSEIEVYTPEEVEAEKQASIEAYMADNPNSAEEVETLKNTLKEKETELEKFKDKDLNFSRLKAKQEQEKQKEVDEAKRDLDVRAKEIETRVLEGVNKDHYEDTLRSLVGDDEELRKKLEYHYKRLNDPITSKSDITKKLTDAFALSTKSESPGALNISVLSSGGVSRLNVKSSTTVLSQEEKALGAKFGLLEEDYKKANK